jgi:hypothetical protein
MQNALLSAFRDSTELLLLLLLLAQVGDAASISFKRMSTFGKRHLLASRPFSAVQVRQRQRAPRS